MIRPTHSILCLRTLAAATAAGLLLLQPLGAGAAASTTTTSLNFGAASTATTLPLTYVPAASGTITTPTTLTDGVVNPTGDFQISAGGTCTTTVTAGTPCTINVSFTPTLAGLRKGAVRITDPSGTVLTTYLSGIGTGAQLTFAPASPSTITLTGLTLGSPRGVTVDGAGNVYAADDGSNAVIKITPSGSASQIITGAGGENLSYPGGVTVDGAGNVWVADFFHARLLVLPAGSTTALVPPIPGLSLPANLASDGLGNIYIANYGANNVLVYSEITQTTKTLATGSYTLASPSGVTVDGAGNVYVADSGHNRIVEVTAAGTAKVLPLSVAPQQLAVDAAGDLYIACPANGEILALPVGATTTQVVASGLSNVWSVAMSPSGNLYASTVGTTGVSGGTLTAIARASPTESFPSTAVGATSPAVSITLENVGNAPLTIGSGGTSAGFNLELATTTCTTTTPLAAGTSCVASVAFAPTTSGPITGTLTINSNAANPAAKVNLTGTGAPGTQAQTITFPAITGTIYVGQSGTPAVSASSGLPVTITSSTTAVCTVNTANLVTILAAGNCTLSANQSGNASYAPAPPVSQTFPVLLNPQQIIFSTIPTEPAGLSGTVPVSASSGLPVTVTSSTTAVCTVSGLTATLIKAGICTLTATQAGNGTYAAAAPVTQSFTVTTATTTTAVRPTL